MVVYKSTKVDNMVFANCSVCGYLNAFLETMDGKVFDFYDDNSSDNYCTRCGTRKDSVPYTKEPFVPGGSFKDESLPIQDINSIIQKK